MPKMIPSEKKDITRSVENDKKKYIQFGKFTQNCPQWLLDKVANIDDSNIDEEYIYNILWIIGDEFNSSKYKTTSTNDIKISRFISVNDVLKKRQASCGSMATVVASVLRNLGIPTKLVHGFYTKHDPDMHHAWNEVNLNNAWIPIDITQESNKFKIGEYHIKKFDALDWEEYENNVDKF